MINKSVFENDLVLGMQRNLASQDQESAMNKLAQAVEFLNSAAELLDEVELSAHADRIVNLLEKVSQMKVKHHSLLDKLSDAGINIFDPEYVGFKTDKKSKIRLNNELYGVGATEHEIEALIGKENTMSKLDVDKWASIYGIKSKHHKPKVEVSKKVDVKKPEVYELEIDEPVSLPIEEEMGTPKNPYVIEAQSKHKKPKDPRKISDRHTSNLTSEKMLKNLKHHGTVFNMADDGAADNNSAKDLTEDSNIINMQDEDGEEPLDLNDFDRLFED